MKKHIYFRALMVSIIILFSTMGWSATLNVGPGQPYLTIQAAINAASPSDIINVLAGTYPENVTVNKSVSIFGAGSASTHVTTSTSAAVFTITADNVTIKNLEIKSNTQLVEGIRVSGATTGLNLDYVDFTNIGNNPGPNAAYGIHFMNSFSNLSVNHTLFSATNIGTYSKGIGIYAAGGLSISTIQIQNSTFSYLWIGVYFAAGVDGFTATNNNFGPQEVQDCVSGVGCIYFGDQSGSYIDIKNITITGNTFSNFGRGIYFYDYATGAVITSVNISNNIFNNSIYSCPIRMIARGTSYPATAEATLLGPVTINNNTFTQTAAIAGGDGVAMVDMRAGVESSSSHINITNNQVTFSGGPYTLPTYGILYRGPITNSNITGNTFTGGGVGGSSAGMPPTSGIVIFTNHTAFGPLSTVSNISIQSNSITGFTNGISIYDHANSVYGGIPTGASIIANLNTIMGNTKGIYSGPGGTLSGEAEIMDATHNYWGSTVAANVITSIVGPVNPSPWCNSTFSVCNFEFSTTTTIYNSTTGASYADLASAIAAASNGDILYFTEPGSFSGFPSPLSKTLIFMNISGGNASLMGASPALSMSAGNFTFYRVGFVTPTNDPTILVTGGTLKLRNCIIVSSTGYANTGLVVSGTGTVDAGTTSDGGYNRFVYSTGDLAASNTGSGVVNAYNCYWGTGSGLTPPGPGALVSGSINYGVSFPAFTQTRIDLALNNPSCGSFSVNLRPYMMSEIQAAGNDCVLNNLVFTVRWPSSAGFSALTNVNMLIPGLALMGSVTLSGSYYYATYATVGGGTLTWNANTEYEIMNFTIPGTGSSTANIAVVNDSWTAANNGDYYIDMISNGIAVDDAAGVIYVTAPAASVNCGIYAKALLTGPYTGVGPNYMTTYLNDAPDQIPTTQPFNTSPWFYTGTETLSSTTDITDWVLVELRSTTTSLFDRKAAVINQTGNIYDVDGVSPVVFHSIIPGNTYYLVINHRNHSPLMSAAVVTLPNTAPARYDFTIAANLYGTAPAISNTGSIYSMVPGDINHDGKLKYSGANNDRALIIAKLGTMFSPVYLNSVSAAGYWLEDLNLNRQIAYSGPNNDASAIIFPALTNLIPGANLISIWSCPVPNTTKNLDPCQHNGSIDATLVVNGNNLDVNLITNEYLTGAFVDNIQFAISWDASLTNIEQLITKSMSDFNITPQGNPVQYGNKMYQMFAMVDWKALPDQFKPGNEVTVLSIPNAAKLSGKLILNANDIIENNDLGYYVSIYGTDKTGQVKNITQTDGSTSVGIYPNPANNNSFMVTLNSLTEEQIDINVCDMIGKVVLLQKIITSAGQNNYKIPTSGLTPGAYLVKLSGSNVNYSTKLVIQ